MLLVVFAVFLLGVSAQENAGNLVASGLKDCYKDRSLLDINSLPPATINVVLDMIRRIENGPAKQNARQLSAELLHRFRQDGIIKDKEVTSNFILPFKPLGFQSEKNAILLQNYIPGDATNFPNETLTLEESCALHYMMSNTIILNKRGDENVVCKNMGRYQRRSKREIQHPAANQFNSTITNSTITNSTMANSTIAKPLGSPKKIHPDTELISPGSRTHNRDSRWSFDGDRSECPIEMGVVHTKWGAIQLGTVIAGIATGFQELIEPIDFEGEQYDIDSSFAATLSGDIAEVAMILGRKDMIQVGAKGGWNSTIEPRYHFLQESENFAMTDSEIRAGADGLILAKNVQEWVQKQPLIRLSQILDMYYSDRGAFSNKYRACWRRELTTEIASKRDQLFQEQAVAFTIKYSKGELDLNGIRNFTGVAIDKFFQYAASMNDMKCLLDEPIKRAAVDLIIVLDTRIEHIYASPAISYLVDNLDVNQFGSNITLISGSDGKVIVNSTSSVIEYFEKYNYTTHQAQQQGFNYANVYSKMDEIMKRKANEDKAMNHVGGRSVVFLLMPYDSPSANDNSFITERLSLYKTNLPEFNIVVAGRASKLSYLSMVFNSNEGNTFQLAETDNESQIASVMAEVVKKIKDYPRKIQNPKCGSEWTHDLSSNSLVQYIEPNTTNYYSIPFHYLGGEQEKTLKLQFEPMLSSINVCFHNGECKQANREISYPLKNYCADYEPISSCPSFKFSVQANETKIFTCKDAGCRFPDMVKYTITVDGLGCTSASSTIFTSSILILAAYLISKLV